MMSYRQGLKENYSPLYYLAALGNGGLAVTFFMLLMFGTPHKETPIPTFDSVMAVLQGSDKGRLLLAILALLGIVFFAFQHFRILIWNIREYRHFKGSEGYKVLKKSNNEVQLMAMPLTYSMSINIGFILGAVFVPGLWGWVEYLLPFAALAFLAVAVQAIVIFINFFGRALADGHFACDQNNSFGQMLAVFAFAMLAVGFAAPAAMTHNPLLSGLMIMASLGALSIAGMLAVTMGILGVRAMLDQGVSKEAASSLWIMVPILTLIGLTVFRLSMALTHNFGVTVHPAFHFIFMSLLIALMLFILALGHFVMKRLGYYQDYLSGTMHSAGAYALICPGVAFFVLSNFFIHKGLIAMGILEFWSWPYFMLYIPLLFVQGKTIQVMFTLNSTLLRKRPSVEGYASS